MYIKEYSNVKDLINALKQYFEFYNFERPHQSLNRNTPAEIYFGELAIQRAA
ncbi:integrase core domain-containing protein [Desulfosarcina sp. BuS5]|uniref:integrase core domain-containing protein n=1 Tax=Desulfosarcina sp. BuS5 TaxID=933262 RepID=UPI000A000592